MQSDPDEFANAFATPPRDCSQIPFWFLNGVVDGDEYARQITEMTAHGVHQVMPHPRFGMDRRDYLNPRYWQAFDQLLERAERDDVLVHLYDEYNWSSGPAGGRVTADESCCALGMGMKHARATGPTSISLTSWTEGLKQWGRLDRFLSVCLAPVLTDGTPDLAHLVQLDPPAERADAITIDVPTGTWEVMAFYSIRTIHPSPLRMGNGGVIDYLNPRAVERFITATHEQYATRYGRHFGQRIRSIFYDECGPYASGPFTWTDDLLDNFDARTGYALLPLLPLLFLDGHDSTEKVRCDYWDTVSELYADRFVGKLATWCDEHGLALTGHSFEESRSWMISADLFRSLRRQQWVGLDALNGPVPFSWLKTAVSVAHVTGRSEVICEALGLLGLWTCSPRMMRVACNRLAIAGVTHLVPHAFFQTIDNPKVECPPSFFEHNPYWRYYRHLADMTARQCWLNRQGHAVADVAIFYPLVAWWGDSRGGRGLGFPWETASWTESPCRPACEAFDAIIDRLMANQIDVHVLDGTALHDASMAEGVLKIAKQRYRLLVLPPMRTIRRPDLRRIVEFADLGGQVIVVGCWPSVSMEDGRGDSVLQADVDRLRQLARFVPAANEVPRAVHELIATDVRLLDGPPESFEVSHRIIEGENGRDLYLVSNHSDAPQRYRLSLRTEGTARRMSVEDGNTTDLPTARREGRTECELRLHEHEFICIEFRSCANTPENVTAMPTSRTSLEGLWKFTPLAKDANLADPAPEQVIELPVFRTAAAEHEPRDNPFAWDRWFASDFDDSAWETANCAREPLLFDDRRSHFFRMELPVGATALALPLPIDGEYAWYLDSKRAAVQLEHNQPDAGWLPISTRETPSLLAIECASMSPQFGIRSPIRVRCEGTPIGLISWDELGLGWFTGRCAYRSQFHLPDSATGIVRLDLGEVRECAEVWLNGKPSGQRIWPPYVFDITDQVRSGVNEVLVVVSNLLANQFAWDVLGSRGRGQTLRSGLFGPVEIEFGII